ncbi:MAG: hypothetical protein ACO3FE_08705 [Planctomycetaceae bacterium]
MKQLPRQDGGQNGGVFPAAALDPRQLRLGAKQVFGSTGGRITGILQQRAGMAQPAPEQHHQQDKDARTSDRRGRCCVCGMILGRHAAELVESYSEARAG